MNDKTVGPDELRIGLFVQLDLPWMNHPFLTSSFKIRTQKQLNALRSLGLAEVRIDPARSDAPLVAAAEPVMSPPTAPATEPPTESAAEDAAVGDLWAEKRQRIERIKQRRSRLNQCAKRYTESVASARKLMAHLRASPAQAAEEARDLMTAMVQDLTADHETTVQLVNLKHQDENSYHHSINVVALALVIGQRLNLDDSDLRMLGLGALFHDLGYQQIPTQVLYKKEPWNRAERALYEQHPRYGVEIAKSAGSLLPGVMEIIGKHHEHLDGSGYPSGLKGPDIGLLTRIVTVVNRYDNLCNGFGGEAGLSPHQAIARMYSKERQCYDPKVLTTFITNLGVYPPGTVVRLADERIAVVISLNQDDLLKPNILVYAADIPKDESPVLNLAEEEIAIRESLHISDLNDEQIDYLNLSDKLSYYFQGAEKRRR